MAWPTTRERVNWSFEDPAAVKGTEQQRLAAFRKVRNEKQQRISPGAARGQGPRRDTVAASGRVVTAAAHDGVGFSARPLSPVGPRVQKFGTQRHVSVL